MSDLVCKLQEECPNCLSFITLKICLLTEYSHNEIFCPAKVGYWEKNLVQGAVDLGSSFLGNSEKFVKTHSKMLVRYEKTRNFKSCFFL